MHARFNSVYKTTESIGVPLRVRGPDTSVLLGGMFSSTNFVTNLSLYIAKFVLTNILEACFESELMHQ